ncbi:MAG TPA: hypothetical protein PLD62_08080 [Candidatus Cloacimonadota bacterium]|nr:hypothetical protein [Candidatus Cloacimonadota bacterium]
MAGQIFGYWLASSILDTPKISAKKEKQENKTSIMLSPYNGGLALNLTYSF